MKASLRASRLVDFMVAPFLRLRTTLSDGRLDPTIAVAIVTRRVDCFRRLHEALATRVETL
jgi:hypothetical protein